MGIPHLTSYFSLYALTITTITAQYSYKGIPLLPTKSIASVLYRLDSLFFNSKKENVSKLGKKYLKLIALLAMIASVAILIEDTFVIFTVDQYSIF